MLKGVIGVLAGCAAFSASSVSLAQTGKMAAPMKMTLVGEGRWTVRCKFEIRNGIISEEKFGPKGIAPVVFSMTNLQRGSCDYKAPGKPLVISVEGDGWTCPFSAPADGKCEQAIAAGASGTFRFAMKGQR